MILGLDIGYSNLVTAFGKANDKEPTIEKRSAVAGEESRFAMGAMGSHGANGYGNHELSPLKVLVDDERWLVGVDSRKLSGWSRQLHEDYPSTKLYEALFKGALLSSEADVIDRLVTGLPCNQILDDQIRNRVTERLLGTHKITPKLDIEVQEVVVVPQPAGAYTTALIKEKEHQEALSEGRVVVFDPGFFSVDWCEVVGGSLSKDMVGSSLSAMSRVLEMTASAIQNDHGALPDIEMLESALRAGSESILFRGKRLDFTEYLQSAVSHNAEESIAALRKQFRAKSLNFDALILAGGGGELYKDAVQSVFDGVPVLSTQNSVESNAEGFWYMGG